MKIYRVHDSLVDLCTCRYGGKPVALKVLREDQNMTEEDRHSFVREAHLLARMTSPYVLKALGGSKTVDKLPCILLEWCDTDATCTWRGDPQQRCSAGHAAGVLTRLEVSGGPDPLAANMACCVIA